MHTYVVPMTFPDLDTAKRDASSIVDALRTSGLHAELVDEGQLESADDAGRPDPGPTTRHVRVRAGSVDEARRRVQGVLDGQLPPGTVLTGDPVEA